MLQMDESGSLRSLVRSIQNSGKVTKIAALASVMHVNVATQLYACHVSMDRECLVPRILMACAIVDVQVANGLNATTA